MMGTVHWMVHVVDLAPVSIFIKFVSCSGSAGPAWKDVKLIYSCTITGIYMTCIYADRVS